MPEQRVRRRLNEIEHFNWCLDQPYNIVVTVRLAGRLEPDELRVALDKAQQRHPLLRVNTVLDGQGVPWLDSDGVGPIPLDVRRREGDADVGPVMDRELCQPFEMDTGGASRACLARVVLLTDGTGAGGADSDGPCDLVISVQHVVTDGLSMLFLVRDLLGFLRDPGSEVQVLQAPASPAAILPDRIARRVARSSRPLRIALVLVRAYLRLRRIPRAAGPDAAGPDAAQPDAPDHSWQLTAEQTSALLTRCRAEGVSVQSAVCTAFLTSHTMINSPVNLRARLARPVGESVGLFVGTALIRARFNARQGFWPNARAFQRKFRRALRNPFLVFRLCSPAVPREQIREFTVATTSLFDRRKPFGVTNLGSLDRQSLGLDAAGSLRVLSFDGRASGFAAASVLTVYTIGGRMHLNLRGTPDMTRQQNQAEAERAMALLLPAIG